MILSFLIITGYMFAVIGNAYFFVLYIHFAFVAASVTILISISNLLVNSILKKRKESLIVSKGVINVTIVFVFLFLMYAGRAINHYLLSNLTSFFKLLGNIGILLFSVFFTWILIKRKKAKIVALETTIFLVFLFLLSSFSSKTEVIQRASAIKALRSLPYIKWTPIENDNKEGVVFYDKSHACDGINIYCPENLSTAFLMDMSGKFLHSWSVKIRKNDTWQYVELCRNGDLLAIVKDKFLIRLDWNSNIIWSKKIRAHHDIAISDNKDIYVLSRKDEIFYLNGIPFPILNDYIVVLSRDGELKKEIPLFNIFKNKVPYRLSGRVLKIYTWMIDPRTLWRIIKEATIGNFILDINAPTDIYHINTLEVLEKGINGLCERGDILLSACLLDLIAILDLDENKLVWSWGPKNLSRQHHPTLLDNENILIFDNGVERRSSRSIEMNPIIRKIVWEYKSKSPQEFYSETRVSSQRLINGNTLITESESGHVFEVTRDGEIVWEFFNLEKKNENQRSTIYRMMRIFDINRYPKIKEIFAEF